MSCRRFNFHLQHFRNSETGNCGIFPFTVTTNCLHLQINTVILIKYLWMHCAKDYYFKLHYNVTQDIRRDFCWHVICGNTSIRFYPYYRYTSLHPRIGWHLLGKWRQAKYFRAHMELIRHSTIEQKIFSVQIWVSRKMCTREIPIKIFFETFLLIYMIFLNRLNK